MEPMEGKMERALDLGSVLTRLHRIAELVQPAGARRPTVEQRTHAPEEPDAGIPHVRICGGARAGNRPGLPDIYSCYPIAPDLWRLGSHWATVSPTTTRWCFLFRNRR